MGVSRKYQSARAARGRAANVSKPGIKRGAITGTAASTGRAAKLKADRQAAVKRRAAAVAAGRKSQKGKQAAGARKKAVTKKAVTKKAATKKAGEFRFYEHPGVRKKARTATPADSAVARGGPSSRRSDKATAALAATVKPYQRKKAVAKKETPTQRYRRQRRRAPGRVR